MRRDGNVRPSVKHGLVDKDRVEVLKDEWHAALVDVGFDVKQVRLYPFPGEKSEAGCNAYYFTPGQRLNYHANFPDKGGAQIEDANKYLDRHRIAAWIDTATPILGARLRHELEHARQVEAFANRIFDLNDLVLGVLWMKLEGFRGSGQLYNAIPLEVDANAAAARFACDRYGEEVARELADPDNEAGFKDGVLFRSLTPPGPIETLPKRMLGFLLQFGDLCELYGEQGTRPFAELLDEVWPGMGHAWEALQAVEMPDRDTRT
jgi:hypothetical protein